MLDEGNWSHITDGIDQKHHDFYQKLRLKIREWIQSPEGKSSAWSEYILLAPDLFHLLCKLMTDDDVSAVDKAKVAAVIAYFVSPFELIPEGIIGPVGYVDDIALAVYVLDSIVNHAGPDVLRRHWAGDEDILVIVKTVLAHSTRIMGKMWGKLVKIADKAGRNIP